MSVGRVSSQIVVRELQNIPAELNQVAAIHCRAFPASAVTQLGVEAAYRYYQWQFEGPHELYAVGAFSELQMVGFCFSGVFRGALGGFLERNRAFLIRRVLTHPWLAFNPLVREKISYSVRRLMKPSPSAPAVVQKPVTARYFSVLSIAVDPDWQGLHVGQQLMTMVEQAALERQFTEVFLSVLADNHQAIQFYKRNGYSRHLGTDQTWQGRMVKRLNVS